MKKKLASLAAVALLVSGCNTPAPGAGKLASTDSGRSSYVRLYCTPDGDTHFETVTIEMAKLDGVPPSPSAFGRRGTATSVGFARFAPRWGTQELQSRKFHVAPAAQWVVYLEGSMSVTASDNETRHFQAGDVLRVEDVAPCNGHISVVGGEATLIMIVR